MNLWLIVLFLAAGFVIGYYRIYGDFFLPAADFITFGGLIILLIAMGAKIGVDERVLSQLNRLGLQALVLAVASIVGSVLLLKIFSTYLGSGLEKAEVAQEFEEEEKDGGINLTLLIFLSVIGGIILGILVIPPEFFELLDRVTTYALAVLLFGVGIDIGKNKAIFMQLKALGWRIALIPVLVAIGSIVGSVIAGYFVGLLGNEAAAVGAGFGWYSLSAVLLTQIYSVELGSLAFLTNVIRELLTFLILPFVVQYFGKISSIGPGGATTMDVTLPLIKETAGREIVIPAFISGVILSTLVPFLVPFLIQL